MLFISMTVSAQSIVLPVDLNKHYIVTAKQAYIDSIALHRCDSALDFQDKQLIALEMAYQNVGKQLIGNTDLLNKTLKDNLKLTKNGKTKNVVILVLASILTTIILFK